MEIQSLMAEPVTESPFGSSCDPSRAPDVVSKAVASLPPEQMFQLMQQMKTCIQNNPHEARTMLLQNPQLAYALLQAQVVMKIVDPETAVTMLHKTQPSVPPVGVGFGRPGSLPPTSGPPSFGPPFPGPGGSFNDGPPRMDMLGPGPDMNGPPRSGMGMPSRNIDQGLPRMSMDHGRSSYPPPEEPRGDPRQRDPRSRDPRDSRDPRGMGRGPSNNGAGPGPMRQPPNVGGPPPVNAGGPGGMQLPPHLAGADPEKAALIMQVLQLTDDQIAVLPAEQRQSIMVLKEQIKQHGPMR